jgi:hypothetical protein
LVPFALVVLLLPGCSDQAEPVSVSGTAPCTEIAPEGEELNRYECMEALDDDRVSGQSTVTVTSLDQAASPIGMEGTYTLTNDGGTWTGDWSGVIEDDGTHIVEGVMAGSGGYDGLQYVARWVFVDLSNVDASGTIESAS